MYPGFGKPALFVHGTNGQPAPTSYPVTWDQKGACNLAVFSADLKALSGAYGPVAKLFAWKGYDDTLYVTVSVNASVTGVNGISNGQQFMVSSPSLTDNYPSVGIYLSSSYPNSLQYMSYSYTSTMVLASSYQFWTCFTVPIPLTQVRRGRGGPCWLRRSVVF